MIIILIFIWYTARLKQIIKIVLNISAKGVFILIRCDYKYLNYFDNFIKFVVIKLLSTITLKTQLNGLSPTVFEC